MSITVPRASLLPGLVPAEEHLHLWRQSIAPMLEAVPITPLGGTTKLPEIHQYHLGRFLFIDSSFGGQHFRRDPALMARHDEADHLTLHLFVRGRNQVVNGGVSYEQNAGNVTAVNLAYDVDARSTEAEALLVVLPRQLILDEVPQAVDLRGPLFADGSVCGGLFIEHLLALRRLLPQAGVETIPALTQSLLAMIDALVVHGDSEAAAVQPTMLAAVCRYIDDHLDDPELSPDGICARFRCSRATLYRLFTRQGGVREHIQHRRLMACFKAIRSPKHRHRRIFDIALDYGFISPSHFSRLFRRHFGLSPSEARETVALPEGEIPAFAVSGALSAADDAARMWLWSNSLTRIAVRRGDG